LRLSFALWRCLACRRDPPVEQTSSVAECCRGRSRRLLHMLDLYQEVAADLLLKWRAWSAFLSGHLRAEVLRSRSSELAAEESLCLEAGYQQKLVAAEESLSLAEERLEASSSLGRYSPHLLHPCWSHWRACVAISRVRIGAVALTAATCGRRSDLDDLWAAFRGWA
ncbi:unnamed protein product, partial [Polarella glacialis]